MTEYTALLTDDVLKGIAVWEQEKQMLRADVLQFWKNEEQRKQFCDFWKSPVNDDAKVALLATAQEDVAKGSFGDYSMVTCPELDDANEFLDDPDKLLQLFDLLCSGKENVSFKTELQEFMAPSAQNVLTVVRSCVLLHFLGVVVIIFSHLQSGGDTSANKENNTDDDNDNADSKDLGTITEDNVNNTDDNDNNSEDKKDD